jgi:hypothetical protein
LRIRCRAANLDDKSIAVDRLCTLPVTMGS